MGDVLRQRGIGCSAVAPWLGVLEGRASKATRGHLPDVRCPRADRDRREASHSAWNSSFREVRVNRGGETVQAIHLDGHLIEEPEQDVCLWQGDSVLVPIAERQVRLEDL